MILRVVEVEAVDDVARPALPRDLCELPVELVLTIITAVRRVGAIMRILELRGLDDLVRRTECFDDVEETVQLALRQARRFAGHAVGALAEFVGRDLQDERRVDAAGEGDDAALERANDLAQPRLFDG